MHELSSRGGVGVCIARTILEEKSGAVYYLEENPPPGNYDEGSSYAEPADQPRTPTTLPVIVW